MEITYLLPFGKLVKYYSEDLERMSTGKFLGYSRNNTRLGLILTGKSEIRESKDVKLQRVTQVVAPSPEDVRAHKYKTHHLTMRPMTVQVNQYDEDFPPPPSDSDSEDYTFQGIVRSPIGSTTVHEDTPGPSPLKKKTKSQEISLGTTDPGIVIKVTTPTPDPSPAKIDKEKLAPGTVEMGYSGFSGDRSNLTVM